MKALIYARVSRDPRGTQRSPAEQEAESLADCEREGWEVYAVLRDVGSASKHAKKERFEWKRAHQIIASGEVDVLVTWAASRAQRDLEAYLELRKLCQKHGVLWRYDGTTYDLSRRIDKFRTGLDALIAEDYVEQGRESLHRALRANAHDGKPHGRRLYGYQRTYDPTTGACTGQIPHPLEAPVVRSLFADAVAGRSMRYMEKRLRDEGVVTSKGTPWTHWQIRNLLNRHSYAGLRVYQGEVIGDAAWEPLVPRETFDKVQARFDAARAKRTRVTSTARLLTGVLRCGKCGGKCHVLHDRRRRKVYQCVGCYGTARDLLKLDAYVSGRIVERLEDGAPITQANTELIAAELELTTLRKRLDDAVSQFTHGKLSASTLAKIEADLQPGIAAAEKRRRMAVIPVEVDLPASGFEEWWAERLDAEQRRAVVNALVSVVTLLPARSGTREFDPSAVVVEFA